MICVTFRPLLAWPGPPSSFRRRSLFKAAWSSTLTLLDRELRAIDAAHIVVQLAITEDDIRLDGWPRANVRPKHPGCIVAFDCRYGALQYASDVFDRWQDNLRAIALGLEALRKVDRFGITKRGEQYTGWKQLSAGQGPIDRIARVLGTDVLDLDLGDLDELSRRAMLLAHPDRGGSHDDFVEIKRWREGRFAS